MLKDVLELGGLRTSDAAGPVTQRSGAQMVIVTVGWYI